MNKLSRLSFILLLLLSSQSGLANNDQYSQYDQEDKAQAGINKVQCPYLPLYRAVEKSLRKTTLTPVDEPLFLSTAYCFGHFSHGRKDQRLLPGYFPDKTAMNLNKRYSQAYKTLQSTEERVAFVHLFLKSLTQQVLVLPVTVGIKPKQIRVILTMSSTVSNHSSLWQFTVTPSGHADVYDGLIALGDRPQITEQWPDLVKLVDEVIGGDGNRRIDG
ncbi:MAG: hypothetical protein HRT35_28115 [Algicola sp.]|nr:hypothetical protein [Algicola sp.]